METKFEAAVVVREDKKVAVVSVNPSIFHNSQNATMIIKSLLPVFPGLPVVLMTFDHQGKPAYFGRADLIVLLEDLENIKQEPWQEIAADIDLSQSCPTAESDDT